MTPLKEIRWTFDKNLNHPMSDEAEEAFTKVYEMTLKPALAKDRWEGEGRAWVLKQVGKIARMAQAEDPDQPISYNALARAANKKIPLASEACQFGGEASEEEGAKKDFGVFCIGFAPLVLL